MKKLVLLLLTSIVFLAACDSLDPGINDAKAQTERELTATGCHQFKITEVESRPEQVTDADRANGIQSRKHVAVNYIYLSAYSGKWENGAAFFDVINSKATMTMKPIMLIGGCPQ